MSASETAKSLGLSSIKEASDICNKPVKTLYNWYKENNQLFSVLMDGCAANRKPSAKGGKNKYWYIKIANRDDEPRDLPPVVLEITAPNYTAAISQVPAEMHERLVKVTRLGIGKKNPPGKAGKGGETQRRDKN